MSRRLGAPHNDHAAAQRSFGARRPGAVRTGVAALVVLGCVPLAAGGAGAAPGPVCPTPGRGYGRMFPQLAAASWGTDALDALAARSMAPVEEPAAPGVADPEENAPVAAAWTYFGQFVDHDLTLDDRTSTLSGTVDPATLTNGRTPQLDLDSLYGSGPAASPQLYEADSVHLKLGAPLSGSPDRGARDVPRDAATGQAVLGDFRNDENRMVAALHSAFLRYHNQVADQVRAAWPRATGAEVFARARSEVVRTYQRIILDEYLPQVVGRGTLDAVLAPSPRGPVARTRWYTTCAQMPVEFSVAAYRFGHSMVRSGYQLNATTGSLPVFSTTGANLSGFSPSPAGWAVDWNAFIAPVPSTPPALRPARSAPGVAASPALQWAYRPDSSLTGSLGLLPLPPTDMGPASLARRNLLRGRQLGLPSGQDVARAMGVTPLRDDQILVGAATGPGAATVAITEVSPQFAQRAPLWSYVLAESVAGSYPVSGGRITGPQRAPLRLGPVGGRIVAETVVGLLASDRSSVLNAAAPAPLRGVPAAPGLRELLDRIAR